MPLGQPISQPARSLIWVAIPLSITVVLFSIVLGSGISRGSTRESLAEVAMVKFDLTNMKQTYQLLADYSHMPDWFDVHYFSLCSGLVTIQDVRNSSTTTCIRRGLGFTFWMNDVWVLGGPALSSGKDQHSIPTKAAVILLIIPTACVGLSILLLLCSIVTVSRNKIKGKSKILIVLRIVFLAIIAAGILRIISSAKITIYTLQLVSGLRKYNHKIPPLPSHAGTGFLACHWVGTIFVWAAFGLSLVAAFHIKREIEPNPISPIGKCVDRSSF